MTDRKPIIPLSVVISTVDPADQVIGKTGDLLRQVRALNGELLVVTGSVAPCTPPSDIRVHHVPGGSVFDCRAAAMSLASGEIVAFTEDHCWHPDDWCARIMHNFSERPNLILLGGAVANGSQARIDDLMNYWMTFSTFAPGQVTARHPCIAQFIVKAAAVNRTPRPGELESAVILRFENVPGAVFVDPELVVRHDQSHGFFNTFVVHFHNGRATGGLSPRRANDRNLAWRKAWRWAWQDCRAHIRRTEAAFAAGGKSALIRTAYVLLILPLVLAHGLGALIGYARGPGNSPLRLV